MLPMVTNRAKLGRRARRTTQPRTQATFSRGCDQPDSIRQPLNSHVRLRTLSVPANNQIIPCSPFSTILPVLGRASAFPQEPTTEPLQCDLTSLLKSNRQAIAELCARYGAIRLEAFGSALRDVMTGAVKNPYLARNIERTKQLLYAA